MSIPSNPTSGLNPLKLLDHWKGRSAVNENVISGILSPDKV
jgi:hypothetical protein